MALSSSTPMWEHIEQHESEDQKHFLQWQLQAREPIRSFADIREGDHLVRKGSFLRLVPYEHHFLCTGIEFTDEGEPRPRIIHYYNTEWDATKQLMPTCLGLGSAIEQLGIVQEMTLPHKLFIKSEDELQAEGNEVERVVWPAELRRYTHAEVASRAKKRKGQQWFNLAKNNCETFVMDCMCDLEISLQVTSAVQMICEMGGTLIKMARQVLQQAPKAAVDLFGDKIGLALTSARDVRGVLPKGVGVGVGVALSIFAEICLACRDIYTAKQKWKAGTQIKNRKEFIKAVIDSVVSAPCRIGGNVVGMIAGQLLIPIPALGGLIGAAVGVCAGHFSSKLLTEFTFTELLAKCIDNYLAADN